MAIEHADLPEDRVETTAGIVSLTYLSGSAARVVAGRNTGWLTLDGERLYATAMFRRDGEAWRVDATNSTVTHVVDDRASDRAEVGVLDRAMKVLERTFSAWRADRPDLGARAVLADRIAEERLALERVESLARQLVEARALLPALESAREEAEAALEAALASMEGLPTP